MVVVVVDVLVVEVVLVVVEGVVEVVEVVPAGLVVEVVLVDGAPLADDAPAQPARTSDAATMAPRQATRKGPGCTMATVPGCCARGQEPVASDQDELGAERRSRTAASDGA